MPPLELLQKWRNIFTVAEFGQGMMSVRRMCTLLIATVRGTSVQHAHPPQGIPLCMGHDLVHRVMIETELSTKSFIRCLECSNECSNPAPQVLSAQSVHAVRQLPSERLPVISSAGNTAGRVLQADPAVLSLPQEAALMQSRTSDAGRAPVLLEAELAALLQANKDEDGSGRAAISEAANLTSQRVTAVAPAAGDPRAATPADVQHSEATADAVLVAAESSAEQAQEAEQAVAALAELPIAGGRSESEEAFDAQAACVRKPRQGTEYNKVRLPDFRIEFEIRCGPPRYGSLRHSSRRCRW